MEIGRGGVGAVSVSDFVTSSVKCDVMIFVSASDFDVSGDDSRRECRPHAWMYARGVVYSFVQRLRRRVPGLTSEFSSYAHPFFPCHACRSLALLIWRVHHLLLSAFLQAAHRGFRAYL